jgi:hypothetical protein
VVLPELEQYRQIFESIAGEANELTTGLSEAQFNWRPRPGQWSIEECLAHLTMVGQWEVRAIEQAIDHGRARGLTASGPFEYAAIERYILRESAPPVRHEMSAPRRFKPLHGQPVTGVLPTFLHVQSQFMRLLERADGLDLRRIKVATPISRFLKMSLGMMFAQAAAHEQRHMIQAHRVREHLPS